MQVKSDGGFVFKKQQGAAFAILLNTLSWYFIGYLMVGKIGSAFPESSIENLALNLVFPSSIIASALAGSVFWLRSDELGFSQDGFFSESLHL